VLTFEVDGLLTDVLAVEDAPGTTGTTEGDLALAGTLNITGNMILGHEYPMFTATGTLIDNGLVVGTLPSFGFPVRGEVIVDANEVRIRAIPEPASAFLLAMAAGIVLRRRTRV
jgi:hypothetical protein